MSEEKLYNINYGFGLYDVNYHYERKKVGKIDLYMIVKVESYSTGSKAGLKYQLQNLFYSVIPMEHISNSLQLTVR